MRGSARATSNLGRRRVICPQALRHAHQSKTIATARNETAPIPTSTHTIALMDEILTGLSSRALADLRCCRKDTVRVTTGTARSLLISKPLIFQLVVGLLILCSAGYQALTGKYLPLQQVNFGAPRTPAAVRVIGGIGVLIGLALTMLSLIGVSVFHLFGR
jgi:hypothetical protein